MRSRAPLILFLIILITGIPAADLPKHVGRRLRRTVGRDHLIAVDDLEPPLR